MTRSKLPALTSLRFFAAFLVILEHYYHYELGHAGVGFFFMLSGFVLAYNYYGLDRPVVAKDFYFKRFARIYPTHLLMFFVAIPMVALHLSARGKLFYFTLASAGLNLALLQSFVPIQKIYFGFNSVSWSISCEMFFYALFPALLGFLALRNEHQRITSCCVLGLIVAGGVAFWSIFKWPVSSTEPVAHWLFYISPFTRFFEFFLGVYLGMRFVERRWTAGSFLVSGAIAAWAITLFSAAYLVDNDWAIVASIWFIPASFLTLYVFSTIEASDGLSGRLLASRPLILLGEASFALYMVHYLLYRYIGAIVSLNAISRAGVVVVAIIVSILVHLFFEKPFHYFLLGLRKGRDPQPIGASNQ